MRTALRDNSVQTFSETKKSYGFVRSLHGVKTEVVRTLLRILCVQSSVITPYELFPPKQKKNPTSQCAPLDQFLVQWSTLAGRICVSGTMSQQNLKRKWGVTMLLSQLPRLELAKRGENGIFPHTPHLFMLCVSPSFSILCNSGSASVSTSLHFSQV